MILGFCQVCAPLYVEARRTEVDKGHHLGTCRSCGAYTFEPLRYFEVPDRAPPDESGPVLTNE